METEQSRKRRRYSPQLKAQILAECDVPGASVAKVAMAHGINANLVHGWRKLARQSDIAGALEQFEEAARLEPNEPAYQQNLARARGLAAAAPTVR